MVYSNSDWSAKSDADIEFRKIKALPVNRFLALLNILYTALFLRSQAIDLIFIINPLPRHMLPIALYRVAGGKAQIVYYRSHSKETRQPENVLPVQNNQDPARLCEPHHLHAQGYPRFSEIL